MWDSPSPTPWVDSVIIFKAEHCTRNKATLKSMLGEKVIFPWVTEPCTCVNFDDAIVAFFALTTLLVVQDKGL